MLLLPLEYYEEEQTCFGVKQYHYAAVINVICCVYVEEVLVINNQDTQDYLTFVVTHENFDQLPYQLYVYLLTDKLNYLI